MNIRGFTQIRLFHMNEGSFAVSIDKNLTGIYLELAPPFNPNRTEPPTKGETIYDYDNKISIVMPLTTCCELYHNFKNIMNKNYVNNHTNNNKLKDKIFVFTAKHSLFISGSNANDLVITSYDKSQKRSLEFTFNRNDENYELFRFYNFIKNVCENLEFVRSVLSILAIQQNN